MPKIEKPKYAPTDLIKLWYDNQLDGEWELTLSEIANRFIQYCEAGRYCETWPLERNIRCFLTDKESNGGLQSVIEESDYEDIHNICYDKWRQWIK